MSRFVDHTGKVFGHWEVLGLLGRDKSRCSIWLCVCTCGTKKGVRSSNLLNGSSTGCGCVRDKEAVTHGMTKTKEYRTWSSIKSRCYNTKGKYYHHYGGRGIKVCERWLESFENFYEDMGERPSNSHSIERLDVNEDYSPDNCVWITSEKQLRNRRKNKNNTSGVTGITRCFEKGELCKYRAAWKNLDGKTETKTFSINKYGKEEAFRLACEARENAIKELNEQGAGYSENHGK